MEYSRSGSTIFVRLDPGDRLVASLIEVATREDVQFGAIVSGVGMVEGLQLAFFCVNDDDYVVSPIGGTYDLSSISGNLSRMDGEPRAHVHLTLNAPDFSTLSGHLIECRTHITMEIFIRVLDDHAVSRVPGGDRPATFLKIG